ncbi:hypothetical protein RND81_03G005800 [Saponaria officinalis]|uniref:Reverse transcriptase zinc-binding domain-containing protein n=1 Tax=Saponaria officinalis TaxID=3572 RepID=A0AAW1M2U2_SAPOF
MPNNKHSSLISTSNAAWGVSSDDTCCICLDAPETVQHVLYECHYSRKIVQEMAAYLNIHVPDRDGISWIYAQQMSKQEKRIKAGDLKMVYYRIWRQRNEAWLENQLVVPSVVCQMACEEHRRWVVQVLKGLNDQASRKTSR